MFIFIFDLFFVLPELLRGPVGNLIQNIQLIFQKRNLIIELGQIRCLFVHLLFQCSYQIRVSFGFLHVLNILEEVAHVVLPIFEVLDILLEIVHFHA